MKKKEFNKLHLFWIIPTIIIVLGMFSSTIGTTPAESTLNEFGEDYKIDLIDACYMSHTFIGDRLKAPSTAKFENCYDADIVYEGNQTYTVYSYVDSQNGFGAMIRTNYYTTILDKQNGYWSLIDYFAY